MNIFSSLPFQIRLSMCFSSFRFDFSFHFFFAFRTFRSSNSSTTEKKNYNYKAEKYENWFRRKKSDVPSAEHWLYVLELHRTHTTMFSSYIEWCMRSTLAQVKISFEKFNYTRYDSLDFLPQRCGVFSWNFHDAASSAPTTSNNNNINCCNCTRGSSSRHNNNDIICVFPAEPVCHGTPWHMAYATWAFQYREKRKQPEIK